MSLRERTLVLVKPEGVQRGMIVIYVRQNLERFKTRGDNHTRCYNTRGAGKLSAVSHRLAKSDRLTHVLGPALYNNLPDQVGTVMQSFEGKGLKLVALKLLQGSEQLYHEHYADIATMPFFALQTRYMSSGPVVAMVWQGSGAVALTRIMIGLEEGPAAGLRCKLSMQNMRNMVHGSDSTAAAQREIALWFADNELVPWTAANETWIDE